MQHISFGTSELHHHERQLFTLCSQEDTSLLSPKHKQLKFLPVSVTLLSTTLSRIPRSWQPPSVHPKHW